jgi:hypothetical protein
MVCSTSIVVEECLHVQEDKSTFWPLNESGLLARCVCVIKHGVVSQGSTADVADVNVRLVRIRSEREITYITLYLDISARSDIQTHKN